MDSPEAPEQLISHEEYLHQKYLDLAKKLAAGEITPEEFTKAQVDEHLNLESRSDYDGLIRNFLNIEGYEKNLDRQIKLDEREKRNSGVALALDIDHLKKFNDTMGHPAGDTLIKTYALVIEQLTRITDLHARLGGDEFGVYLIGATIQDAQEIAERIRQEIIQKVKNVFISDKYPKFNWEQTISIGLAEVKINDSAKSLRQRADIALYKAKEERNRVVIWQEGMTKKD